MQISNEIIELHVELTKLQARGSKFINSKAYDARASVIFEQIYTYIKANNFDEAEFWDAIYQI